MPENTTFMPYGVGFIVHLDISPHCSQMFSRSSFYYPRWTANKLSVLGCVHQWLVTWLPYLLMTASCLLELFKSKVTMVTTKKKNNWPSHARGKIWAYFAANIITMSPRLPAMGVRFLAVDIQLPLTSTSCPHTCSFLWSFILSLVRFHVILFHVLLSVQIEGNKNTLLHKNLCVLSV